MLIRLPKKVSKWGLRPFIFVLDNRVKDDQAARKGPLVEQETFSFCAVTCLTGAL